MDLDTTDTDTMNNNIDTNNNAPTTTNNNNDRGKRSLKRLSGPLKRNNNISN